MLAAHLLWIILTDFDECMAIAPPKRKSAIQVFFMVVLLGLLTNPAEVDARKIPFVSLKPIVLNMAEDELSTKVGNGCEKATITQGTVNGAYGVDNTMDYVDVPDNHPNKVRFYRAIANGTESGY